MQGVFQLLLRTLMAKERAGSGFLLFHQPNKMLPGRKMQPTIGIPKKMGVQKNIRDDKANILASLVTISSHLRSHPLRTASSAAFSLNGVKGMVRSSSTHSRLMLEI